MNPQQIAALEASATAAEKAAADAGGKDANLNKVATDAKDALSKAKVPSQDPVKNALDREKGKRKYTEKEQAVFTLKKVAAKVKELGDDPKAVLGIEDEDREEEDDDEVPDWYKKEEAKKQTNTALEMADSISNQDERDLVKEYINHRLVPSGNAEDDFKLARQMVLAQKNKQILDEVNRGGGGRVTASGGSMPARAEEAFEPTTEEARFMRPPYNLSKEKIIEARKKATQE